MGLTDALLLDPYPFEIFIAKRTDGVKGSGTLNDPYDASTATAFDAIMNNLPGATLVHLGPGEFQTNGYSDQVSGGWQMRSGMRIVGAGMLEDLEPFRSVFSVPSVAPWWNGVPSDTLQSLADTLLTP